MSTYWLTYIAPGGLEYALNDNVNLWLRADGLRGFGIVRAEVAATRLPYRDGVWRLGGPYTPAREMEVALEVLGVSLADCVARLRALARNVSPYRDPDELGTLRVRAPDGLTRDIDCWLTGVEDTEWAGPLDGIVVLTFWAPSPWFYSTATATAGLVLACDAGVSYPVSYDGSTGVEYATSDIAIDLSVRNEGDVDTYPTLTIYGPGQNPVVENLTTGQLIEIETVVLEAGDYITVDMDACTVQLYDMSYQTTANIIEHISENSEFWPLRRGDNSIHVEIANADAGTIHVSWLNRYQSA